MTTLERVVQILSEVTPNYMDEYDLQAALHGALADAGMTVNREVRGSDGISRFDITAYQYRTADWIVVEVKVDGALAAVIRQLTRYANLPEVAALVLVTTRSKHHHIPTELNDKPVRLVSLIGAGL